MRAALGAGSPSRPLMVPSACALSRSLFSSFVFFSSSGPWRSASLLGQCKASSGSRVANNKPPPPPYPLSGTINTPSSSKRSMLAPARRTLLSELENLREEKDVATLIEYQSPLKVVLYPDPRLRAKNKRISVFDEKLEKLVKEMFEVMYETDGVGLSAPQVGVNAQLMVFNPEGEKGKGEEIVLINPKIFKYANKRSLFTEGCLSFPGIEAEIERPVSVKIWAQDLKGRKFDIHLKGFQARIFQHEYDHLQSTLFFERTTPEVLDTIIPALQKLEDEYEQKSGGPSPERVSTKEQR